MTNPSKYSSADACSSGLINVVTSRMGYSETLIFEWPVTMPNPDCPLVGRCLSPSGVFEDESKRVWHPWLQQYVESGAVYDANVLR